MKPTVYLSIAESELSDAAAYYNSQQEGLGTLFLDGIVAAEARILRNPRLYRFVEKPIRSCRVERFPYRLLYVEETEQIVIVAVMHLSRDPDYWKERLK